MRGFEPVCLHPDVLMRNVLARQRSSVVKTILRRNTAAASAVSRILWHGGYGGEQARTVSVRVMVIGLACSSRLVEQSSKFPRRTHVWWTVSGRFCRWPLLADSVTVYTRSVGARGECSSSSSKAEGLVRGGKKQPRRRPAPGHGRQEEGPRCREEARERARAGPA